MLNTKTPTAEFLCLLWAIITLFVFVCVLTLNSKDQSMTFIIAPYLIYSIINWKIIFWIERYKDDET
jgi:hypothetical protein